MFHIHCFLFLFSTLDDKIIKMFDFQFANVIFYLDIAKLFAKKTTNCNYYFGF